MGKKKALGEKPMKKKTFRIIATLIFVAITVALMATSLGYAYAIPEARIGQSTIQSVQSAYPAPTPYCKDQVPDSPPDTLPYPEPYDCVYFPAIFNLQQFMGEIFGEH